MREIAPPIRRGRFWHRPHRLLLKLAALRRAELAIRTGAGSEGIKGRQIARNLDSECRSRCQTGRTRRSPGARETPLKLENAGLRPGHTRQAWQATSAAGCR